MTYMGDAPDLRWGITDPAGFPGGPCFAQRDGGIQSK